MSRLDDHHHRSKLDRDVALQREASGIKQREWEQAQDPILQAPVLSKQQGQTREPLGPTKPEALSRIEEAKLLPTVVVEQVDFAVNETILSTLVPDAAGPAITLARTAADLYAHREAVVSQANDAVHHGTRALKDAGQAAARSLSKGGREVGQQMAQGMNRVGSSSNVDPFIKMKVRDMNELERRAGAREAKRPQNPDR
jgi:hypothetical protein